MKIKTLLFLVLAPIVFARAAHAAGFVCTFTNNATVPVDFVVEEKKPDGTWAAVATGPSSPINILNVSVGTHSYRVLCRELANTANVSAPSGIAAGALPPEAPSSVTVTVVLDVTISANGTATVNKVKLP